jgi:hypothetical protein
MIQEEIPNGQREEPIATKDDLDPYNKFMKKCIMNAYANQEGWKVLISITLIDYIENMHFLIKWEYIGMCIMEGGYSIIILDL